MHFRSLLLFFSYMLGKSVAGGYNTDIMSQYIYIYKFPWLDSICAGLTVTS